jgi:mRNA-degrading endonuclease RelE of RelBE toxin-antitoxin system
MKRLEWTRKAAKQLLALPEKAQRAVHHALSSMLDEWPTPRNVKALTHRGDFRLRVGRYRVIFLVLPEGEFVIFKIAEVKKRDESTY